MLRGLYDFKPLNARTLPFKWNDTLIYISAHPRDRNWVRASNIYGGIGLVPINYIDIREGNEDFFMAILDHAIKCGVADGQTGISEVQEIRQEILQSTAYENRVKWIEKEIAELKSVAISEVESDGNVVPRQQSSPVHDIGHGDGQKYKKEKNGNGNNTPLVTTPTEEKPKYKTSVTVTNVNAIASKNEAKFAKDSKKHSSKTETYKKAPAPLPPPLRISSPSPTNNNKSNDVNVSPTKDLNIVARSRLSVELVDSVRNSTGLSHAKSQVAVQTVIHELQMHFQGQHGVAEELEGILRCLDTPCAIRNFPILVSTSSDAKNLRDIFKKLTEHKNDEQQRSWALFEDEGNIIELIGKLNTILKNADQSICKHVMNAEQYSNVQSLVLYYQMETRWSIRSLLLESFAYMASIDHKALSVLLNSILPMELAREIVMNPNNNDKISSSASLLGLLMSTGESIPITHYEHLGTDFLKFVLDIIESPPDDDEKIIDTFVGLVLAYNLHFSVSDENFTIQALAEKKNAKVFTQKIVYLLNWEVDPVALHVHEPKPQHSVFKLMIDIFSCSKTADLFYTNDVKVLIDIITRCLTDLGPGDKRRTAYLRIIRVVLRNTNYADHLHRRDDLLKSFTSILIEEDPLSVTDKNLIRDITKEFPVFVK